MLIDMHTHTFPCSPCSQLTADQLIREAMRSGVDAICVTDHLRSAGGREAQMLASERYGFPVLRGVEARTTLGDVLVFGLDEDFEEGIDGPALLRYVSERGGASVLAHPFRHGGGWALWYWLQVQGLELGPELAGRSEFADLHAVETRNGHVNAVELTQAERLAEILGLPAAGGSDAHGRGDVGHTATDFERPVRNEKDLVRELRAGRFRPWGPRQSWGTK